MRLNQRHSIIFIFLMLCGLLATHRAARAQSSSYLKLDETRVSWTHLSFHAKNFWVEVSTDIQMKSLRASDLGAVLLASPKGTPIKPQTPQINEMTINTIIDPRFRSPVKIHNRIWFNPTDASAIGRVRLRRGEDDFKKTYRFTEQGVFRHRIEPQNKGEARLEPDKWTDIKDTFYPYDINQLGCPGISERSVMIYIISAAAISKNNTPLTFCIFGKRQLHRVQLRKEGILPIKINYIEKNQQVETRKEGILKALKMVITAQPIEPHLENGENFSFLGFHKDITIYIDPTSGLPIQASGIIPTIGKADLVLEEVESGRISD
ncbi:MAG: hypothetical protein PVH36_11810 [Desulfobacterales bacterium]|jgi:hypothetical protein